MKLDKLMNGDRLRFIATPIMDGCFGGGCYGEAPIDLCGTTFEVIGDYDPNNLLRPDRKGRVFGFPGERMPQCFDLNLFEFHESKADKDFREEFERMLYDEGVKREIDELRAVAKKMGILHIRFTDG